MNIEMMKSSGLLMMECVAGSHMYGINRPESDKDIRGLFRLHPDAWLSIMEPPQEVADEKQDIKYFELRKIIKLATDCNPNIIELLWVPDDCMLFKNNVYEELKKNRSLFISKKAQHTFLGYSYSQIKRAKGQNKKVNEHGERVNERGIHLLKIHLTEGDISVEWLERHFNKNFAKYVAKGVEVMKPMVTEPRFDDIVEKDISSMLYPRREDFCFWMDKNNFDYRNLILVADGMASISDFPGRPMRVDFNLDGHGVSSVEHIPHLYRLYHGGNYEGVFKGGEVVCTSIPKEREWIDFKGLLLYNENEYQKAKSSYDSFWEWMANKNDARWIAQEKKEMSYDSKNMSHVFRLLFEAKHLAIDGEPKVRLEGEELEFVRDVRSGHFEYEILLEKATIMEEEVKGLFEKTSLPHGANVKKINALYIELLNIC